MSQEMRMAHRALWEHRSRIHTQWWYENFISFPGSIYNPLGNPISAPLNESSPALSVPLAGITKDNLQPEDNIPNPPTLAAFLEEGLDELTLPNMHGDLRDLNLLHVVKETEPTVGEKEDDASPETKIRLLLRDRVFTEYNLERNKHPRIHQLVTDASDAGIDLPKIVYTTRSPAWKDAQGQHCYKTVDVDDGMSMDTDLYPFTALRELACYGDHVAMAQYFIQMIRILHIIRRTDETKNGKHLLCSLSFSTTAASTIPVIWPALIANEARLSEVEQRETSWQSIYTFLQAYVAKTGRSRADQDLFDIVRWKMELALFVELRSVMRLYQQLPLTLNADVRAHSMFFVSLPPRGTGKATFSAEVLNQILFGNNEFRLDFDPFRVFEGLPLNQITANGPDAARRQRYWLYLGLAVREVKPLATRSLTSTIHGLLDDRPYETGLHLGAGMAATALTTMFICSGLARIPGLDIMGYAMGTAGNVYSSILILMGTLGVVNYLSTRFLSPTQRTSWWGKVLLLSSLPAYVTATPNYVPARNEATDYLLPDRESFNWWRTGRTAHEILHAHFNQSAFYRIAIGTTGKAIREFLQETERWTFGYAAAEGQDVYHNFSEGARALMRGLGTDLGRLFRAKAGQIDPGWENRLREDQGDERYRAHLEDWLQRDPDEYKIILEHTLRLLAYPANTIERLNSGLTPELDGRGFVTNRTTRRGLNFYYINDITVPSIRDGLLDQLKTFVEGDNYSFPGSLAKGAPNPPTLDSVRATLTDTLRTMPPGSDDSNNLNAIAIALDVWDKAGKPPMDLSQPAHSSVFNATQIQKERKQALEDEKIKALNAPITGLSLTANISRAYAGVLDAATTLDMLSLFYTYFPGTMATIHSGLRDPRTLVSLEVRVFGRLMHQLTFRNVVTAQNMRVMAITTAGISASALLFNRRYMGFEVLPSSMLFVTGIAGVAAYTLQFFRAQTERRHATQERHANGSSTVSTRRFFLRMLEGLVGLLGTFFVSGLLELFINVNASTSWWTTTKTLALHACGFLSNNVVAAVENASILAQTTESVLSAIGSSPWSTGIYTLLIVAAILKSIAWIKPGAGKWMRSWVPDEEPYNSILKISDGMDRLVRMYLLPHTARTMSMIKAVWNNNAPPPSLLDTAQGLAITDAQKKLYMMLLDENNDPQFEDPDAFILPGRDRTKHPKKTEAIGLAGTEEHSSTAETSRAWPEPFFSAMGIWPELCYLAPLSPRSNATLGQVLDAMTPMKDFRDMLFI